MSLLKNFINKIKQHHPFEPKFKVGDIIKNDGVKCVAQVISTHLSINDPDCKFGCYGLLYFKNPKAKETPEEKVGVNGTYIRTKLIRKIDAYYELVPEEVAQLLYKSKGGGTK